MKLLRLLVAALAGFTLAQPSAPAQDTRLSNVSVRTLAGGANTLITGFTIGPGPDKVVLVRAVGPTLGVFGVADTLADPKLELFNSASVKIAENDNFNAADAATFAAVGAFALAPGSRDAALVATLAPGGYSAQVSGLGAASGVALVEVYEVGNGASRLINLSTRAQVGTGGNILIPGITIAPGAGTRRLLVRAVGPTLGIFGVPSVLADPKLELFNAASIKIAENDNWSTPANSAAADATTLAAAFAANGAFALNAGSRDAALLVNLAAGSYTLQVSGVGNTTGTALVEVYDLTPTNQTGARPNSTLYVAQLRADGGAAGSLAWGYATILINPDGSALVGVTFANLSSAQTSTHLQIGASRDFVFNLPAGQVTNRLWTFAPSGAYTTNDLINALNSGNLSIGLDTANFPGGELRGTFLAATGSQNFTAPAAPPAVALANITATDAARFLTQATFGPKKSEIDALTGGSINAWIDAQLALPYSSHRAAALADRAAFGGDTYGPNWNDMTQGNRLSAWYKHALTAPDQLRQRVTFALSELFVTSDFGGSFPEANVAYYDVLGNAAFGNFRTLLENVTLNPMMGEYLSLVRNRKANPATGSTPDENYAREVMQLFTIGLNKLQPDGTLLLGADGLPIPSYDQTTITETAKVLTGWTYYDDTTFTITGGFSLQSKITPMIMFPAQHENSAKTIINGTVIPANQGGARDLQLLLDALFQHPNTGPFIARQLIQRLVTSNPSPGYVYRVAQKFADNGAGERGDLKAVVRAILTDYEARSPVVAANPTFGKIKEPLLRVTSLFRAFNVSNPAGRPLGKILFVNGAPLTGATPRPADGYTVQGNGYIGLELSDLFLAQAPLRSPSVFNFFHPDYVSPGPLAAAGMVAPEMEITDETFAVSVPNFLQTYIFQNNPGGPTDGGILTLDLSYEQTLANDPAALVDHLNLILCGGSLPTATRARILTALASLTPQTGALEKARTAVLLIATSPAGATQK